MKSKDTDHRTESVLEMLNRIDDYVLPIEEYLARNYGTGSWKLDPYSNEYVVPDTSYEGPGCRYLLFSPDCREYSLVLPATQIN
jgi:hypothetical protein